MTTVRTEASVPALAERGDLRNIPDLLLDRLAADPEHVAFEIPDGDGWRPITRAQFVAEVVATAKGLVGAGVRPGERVAVMAATRYGWAVVDLACWFAGAVVVPIYDSAAPGQAEAILADADVTAAVAGTPEQADLLREAFGRRGVRPVGVWSMDTASGSDLAALVERGAAVTDAELDARREAVGPDADATIVYTSGTTAVPKGVRITHGNFLAQVLNVAAAYGEVVHPRGNTVIFLPMAHVLARALQLACLAGGMRIAHVADPRAVLGTLAVLRPTFLVVVPRVLEKILAGAANNARRARLGRVWSAAERTAVAWGSFLETRDADPAARPPLGLRVRHAAFDRLFYARLRALLGGRLDYMLSGAAALDADLCRFFRGAGVEVIEGYGLTETTAPLTGNLPGSIRAGTVGVPIPGTSLKIAADGEVLARGAGVFAGYRDPADDADAFVDGWFRTGDLGSLDADGRLTLHGRSKDLLVTAGGKNVAPAAWEHRVEHHAAVAHAVMVGEGRPYLAAVVVLDREDVASGSVTEVTDAAPRAAVAAAVADANAHFSRAEQVRRFAVVTADLSVAGGLVTPTFKLKRSEFLAHVEALVERLYAEG